MTNSEPEKIVVEGELITTTPESPLFIDTGNYLFRVDMSLLDDFMLGDRIRATFEPIGGESGTDDTAEV